MPATKLPDFLIDANDIQKSLKTSRIRCGMNQKAFAKVMNKSQAWVSDVENGKTEISIKDACWWLENCDERLMICGK